jgi:nucleotide-binding universal stress UspA family protein
VYAAIVVGTDGSETAAKAVSTAATIAETMGARLHVVTAFGSRPADIPEELAKEYNWMASAGAQADVILRQAVNAVGGAGVEMETHARAGDAAAVIIDVAVEVDADLIVVGNKGMTGVARFLLGSVPNKIAHHAPCDVLIARTT